MTRRGKIARLPRHIRHKLNLRLEDGEQGGGLVEWLNGLDQVKEVLRRDFEGRPINEQNLSEWKQGGFPDWQRRQETCDNVRRLVDLSDDLDDAADERTIADRFAAVLAAELAANTARLLEKTTDPAERFTHICKALGQLYALRTGDQMAERVRMETERREIENEERQRKEMQIAMEEARQAATAPLWDALRRPTLVAAFGGGEAGEKAADLIQQANRDFKAPASSYSFIDELSGHFTPPGQTKIKPKSNLIKPNQT